MIDHIIHAVCAAIVASQALLIALGVNPAVAAAVIGVVVAFQVGYRTDRSALRREV